ncbi:MAG TPA: inositol monophosphatase [Micropruina sp.]|jgi:fructose-1,6-bisphosphatase/inositol monophosphatase family enzyme|nr:inositol monophosphatase [Micropruina sp.]
MDTDAVTEAIRQVAAAEIMPRFRALADDEVIEKRPGDVVTVADRLAEHALTEIFRRADPGCLVVGEEGVYADPTPLAALPHAELAWVIDPVDGTRNFTEGSPDFAVMVAEVRAGVTTRSWIWQPVHDLMMIAERGAGVTRNGVAVVPPVRPKPLVGALHGRYGHPRGGVPDDVRLVRLAGCCGVDYPDLIEGRRAFLGYWSMHPWDHLPGGLMVTETGGVTRTMDGRAYVAGVRSRYLLVAADEPTWQSAADLAREQFAR